MNRLPGVGELLIALYGVTDARFRACPHDAMSEKVRRQKADAQGGRRRARGRHAANGAYWHQGPNDAAQPTLLHAMAKTHRCVAERSPPFRLQSQKKANAGRVDDATRIVDNHVARVGLGGISEIEMRWLLLILLAYRILSATACAEVVNVVCVHQKGEYQDQQYQINTVAGTVNGRRPEHKPLEVTDQTIEWATKIESLSLKEYFILYRFTGLLYSRRSYEGNAVGADVYECKKAEKLF